MTLEHVKRAQDIREDEASLLVGRIIRHWAALEDYIDSAIGSLQMRIRMRVHRLPRQWYSHAPRDLSDLSAPDFRERRMWPTQSPDRKWKLKLSYFKRLCLTLMHDDSEFQQNLDRMCGYLHDLFTIRNDVAHGGNSVSSPWEESGIRIRNQDWKARNRKQAMDGIPRGERSRTEKFYSLEYLSEVAASLLVISCGLRQLVESIPDVGSVHDLLPIPPRR